MAERISITALFMFLLWTGFAHADTDKDAPVYKREKDNISVLAKIPSEINDISDGLFVEIDITNHSSDDISIMDHSQKNQSKRLFKYELVKLPSKTAVKLTNEAQNAKNSLMGKFDWIVVAPQKTYSLKVNLMELFMIEKNNNYCLTVVGFLYLKDNKNIPFTLNNLEFIVK